MQPLYCFFIDLINTKIQIHLVITTECLLNVNLQQITRTVHENEYEKAEKTK